jgi:hypothetical protein
MTDSLSPLSGSEAASLRALAAGLFDHGAGVDPDRLDWAIVDLAQFLRSAGPRTTFLFRLALFAVTWMPIFFVGRARSLPSLSDETAARYLEALDRSRLGALLLLPKALFSLVYYEHPDSLHEIGFDKSCMMGELPAGVGLVRLAARAKKSAEERAA